MALWTPEAKSFFPLAAYRWIVTPYSRLAYGRPDEQGQVAFRVHNNSGQTKTIRLQIEFPGESWPVRLSKQHVTLPVKEARDVLVHYTVPGQGQTRVCHIRATPAEDPDFTTYSTLTVAAGESPAERPLKMPIVLKPYCHENEQFGYLPDYPVEAQPYFDPQNRPFMLADRGLATWRDGQWTATDLRATIAGPVRGTKSVPAGLVSS